MADGERFTLRFDGEAFEDGAIDTRELAPSLLALADLFDAAINAMGDERTKIIFASTRISGLDHSKWILPHWR